MAKHEQDQAGQVPLVELLRGVPAEACLELGNEVAPTRWRHIPVGRYCQQAARILDRVRESERGGGCTLAGLDRGDCEHFVGLPGHSIPGQHDGPDDTVGIYGKPNGWCWSCWRSHQLALARKIISLQDEQLLAIGKERNREKVRADTAEAERHIFFRESRTNAGRTFGELYVEEFRRAEKAEAELAVLREKLLPTENCSLAFMVDVLRTNIEHFKNKFCWSDKRAGEMEAERDEVLGEAERLRGYRQSILLVAESLSIPRIVVLAKRALAAKDDAPNPPRPIDGAPAAESAD